MTMTDGERAIIAQLKRIADNLDKVVAPMKVNLGDPATFADAPRRLMEGGYTGRRATDTIPVPTDNGYVIPKTQIHKYGIDIPKDYIFPGGYVPTESNTALWERLMRLPSDEGEHLLNPDADHTGEDVE